MQSPAKLEIHPDQWTYYGGDGQTPLSLTWPVFEINGRTTENRGLQWSEPVETALANSCTEVRRSSPVGEGVILTLVLRFAPDSPILRFRYELSADGSASATCLTRSRGADAISYAGFSLADFPAVTEVRLSEWIELHHSYELDEIPLAERDFETRQWVMGPILAASSGTQSVALAYEHGSTWPDAFLAFALAPGHQVTLEAVHGNTFDGQPADGFASVWFLLGIVKGTVDDLASAFRSFFLTRQALNPESRKPYIFYNTWNYQERNKSWYNRPYLAEMEEERMLREIEAAHRIGIEVFVLDTGWYQRTGDWRVNPDRFPENMKSVKAALDRNGMKLGLWFDNSAGVTSDMLHNHMDCRCSLGGVVPEAEGVWETEPAHKMCLVSRYWEAFADELIRLHREVGVSYFKWDAIGQYSCSDPRHLLGTTANSEQERAESFAFQLPLYMARIAEKVSRACPGTIIDFDVTEPRRAFGLAFLSAGKFFLINNGPYCTNYDLPKEVWPHGNGNFFFHPGAARTWICRQPLSFDKWVPMNLFLTHYLPDDGPGNQVNCVASLILGQNGIWGDLPAVSTEGVETFHSLLGRYKQVRADIAAASPLRRGPIGGAFEVHEKINAANGQGAAVFFATSPGTHRYVTERPVDPRFWATPGAEVTLLPDGRADITLTYGGKVRDGAPPENPDWAKIVFFGVE